MNLELRSRGVRVTRELREHVEKRLHFALGRFADRLHRIRVDLQDVNGPRGGEDVGVRIRAEIHPGGVLIVDELRECPFSAVASASDRIGQSVARRMKRVVTRRRRRSA
ncbi:HPF/RaiA family ribosome-associated protein [Engelhardtia mirabilis]|uniref:Sigma 54 modulation protein / S30EA ribosomal protein n=1 Tax=Engelhardtia mirabilis TaxID=2528011 RepID=A0A518BMY3_9BACT|nr:Sigma 54 modulation protein / S30EA ribosomal protein [Planctomycetes bacterium Pla133]QDV02664.1 Sigma 54 modulation protein / S30EA ribosomal protein [Planctomycetes bacterium Pla86]